jgi:hypothetical protein
VKRISKISVGFEEAILKKLSLEAGLKNKAGDVKSQFMP